MQIMERRQLMSLLLASPLGWFVPNTAKAAILPGSQYKHFGQVLNEIVSYVSMSSNSEVLCTRNPKDCTVEFFVSYVEDEVGYSRSWILGIHESRRLVGAMPDPLGKILIERALLTPSGRETWARVIQKEGRRRHTRETSELSSSRVN